MWLHDLGDEIKCDLLEEIPPKEGTVSLNIQR